MSCDASSRRQTTPCAQPQAVLRAEGRNAEQGPLVSWMRGLWSGPGRSTVAGLGRGYLCGENDKTGLWDLSSALVDVGCSYGACHALFRPFWL